MLPDNIIHEIFKFLPVETIINYSTVCKQFNKVANCQLLWKEICSKYIDDEYMQQYFKGDYLECYKEWSVYNFRYDCDKTIKLIPVGDLKKGHRVKFYVERDNYYVSGIGRLRCNYFDCIDEISLDAGSIISRLTNTDGKIIPMLKELDGTSNDDTIPYIIPCKFVPIVYWHTIHIIIKFNPNKEIPEDFTLSYDRLKIMNKYTQCVFSIGKNAHELTTDPKPFHYSINFPDNTKEFKSSDGTTYSAILHDDGDKYNHRIVGLINYPSTQLCQSGIEHYNGGITRYNLYVFRNPSMYIIYTKGNSVKNCTLLYNTRYDKSLAELKTNMVVNSDFTIIYPLDKIENIYDVYADIELHDYTKDYDDNDKTIEFLHVSKNILRCVSNMLGMAYSS